MLNDQSKDAQDFLSKHIHARANILINELLEKGQKDWDLLEHPWFEDLFCQYQEQDLIDNNPLNEDDEYSPSEPDLDHREPYEFWIVSDYLASKLKVYNALLTNHWGFWIWGRETTGQSILIDWIFQKIYSDYKSNC